MSKCPVTQVPLITGRRDRPENPVQLGPGKMQPGDFMLNELKSSIDRVCFDPV